MMMKTKSKPRWRGLEDIIFAAAQMVRPAEKLTVSEWAAKYRYLNNPGSYVGYWNNDFAPYLVEPMDTCISLDHTGMIFVGPARSGKSDIFFNWLGHTALCDPADMTIYTMSNNWGRDWSQGDLEKAFRAKPAGASESIFEKLIMPGKQNRNIFDVRFMSGMRLRISWPAITEMSGKTFPRSWLNDYDHMEQDIAKMGPPYDLAKKRAATFRRFGMCVAESTPGFPVIDPTWISSTLHEAPPVASGILNLYNRGDRRRWYWRCPHAQCRESFEPDFSLLVYDENAGTASEIGATVKMVCPCCGDDIFPDQRRELNLSGRWLRDGQKWDRYGVISGEYEKNEIASFWLKGPAAFMQDWSSMVTKYLQAMQEYERNGNTNSLKSTMELDQALPFVPPRNELARLPEELKSRREDWGSTEDNPTVPPWVRFLVATIDVQARSFVYQVQGFGPGNDLTLIDYHKIRISNRPGDRPGINAPLDPGSYPEDWDLLISEVIERSYPLADGSGRRMAIKISACDSAGAPGVTTNAYEFWRRLKKDPRGHHRRFHLLKGEPSKSAARIKVTYPDAGRKDRHSGARGDVPVQLMNGNALKDQLFGMLGRTTPGGGMVRFPFWSPNWVYKQLTVEERTSKGWENPRQLRNEVWDCCYYALGISLHMDIRLEHLPWDNEGKLPGWARQWDDNDLIIAPEAKNPLVATKKTVVDLQKIAEEWC
jgi:phage terminase large subunit GpA-like protein